jgi:hypothetical protein
MPDSVLGRRWAPNRNQKTRSEQPINRSAAGLIFWRGKQWGKGERRLGLDLQEVKLPVVQETLGGMLFDEKIVVFTRILVTMVVRRGFFHRGGQASIGMGV